MAKNASSCSEKGSDAVIPGITGASGVGSRAGVPLTHRGVATSARLLTGHLMKKEKKKMDPGKNLALSSPRLNHRLNQK